MSLPDPRIEPCELPGGRGDLLVVRDDDIPGGTKHRVAPAAFKPGIEEYVFGSPAEGFAQVALAYACADHGLRSHIFVAKRKKRHPNTDHAARVGAQVTEVEHGRLNVVRSRAERYCAETGAVQLPLGLYDPEVVERLAAIARTLDVDPPEVWCVAGSGVLSRSLALAWPDAALKVVAVGRLLREGDVPSHAQVMFAPESFGEDAKDPPPFSSCANYDAKAWQFMRGRACHKALFWNVAGGHAAPAPTRRRGRFTDNRRVGAQR